MTHNEHLMAQYLRNHKLLDYTTAVIHFTAGTHIGTAKRTEDLYVEDAITDFNYRKSHAFRTL